MRIRNTVRDDLLEGLRKRVIGQNKAVETIIPFIEMHQAGLTAEGRPVGVFLLLGPTGTGKTRTVEALADVLHGTPKNVLRIDCGEFHLEHEVAKLIGAPPGYLGHRETHPLLTQARLASVTSRSSDISIVLFDEIEKAAPSMQRLLLGILDKATLRLGDNTAVNFDHSLIFLTSNLGAAGMMKTMERGFGFVPERPIGGDKQTRELESIAVTAARRHFSPEFMNRIDASLTYSPLSEAALRGILEIQLHELEEHIERRLGARSFTLTVSREGRRFLLAQGTSGQYGARELKRTIQRHLVQPLASMVASGRVRPGGNVRADYSKRTAALSLKAA